MADIEKKQRNKWMVQTGGLVFAAFGFSYLSIKYGDNLFLKFAAGGSGMGLIVQIIRLGVQEFLYEKQQDQTSTAKQVVEPPSQPPTKQIIESPLEIPIAKEEASPKKPFYPLGAFDQYDASALRGLDDFDRPKRTRKRKKSKK